MTRRRFVYDKETKQVVEVPTDWEPTAPGATHRSEEEVFGHAVTTEGVDISTRRRWREYMQRTGLTGAEDYKETWAKAQQQREAARDPSRGIDHKARREAVGRAVYELEKRGRRR